MSDRQTVGRESDRRQDLFSAKSEAEGGSRAVMARDKCRNAKVQSICVAVEAEDTN
jgi:hypothetical protein